MCTDIADQTDFEIYRDRWSLIPDGKLVRSIGSRLYPVRYDHRPAMLKIALDADEQGSADVMRWWDGDGAARVYAGDARATVIERATGIRSLLQMARTGQDDNATRILCAVAAKLHRPRQTALPGNLVPLAQWFEQALYPIARAEGGLLGLAAQMAQELLSDPRQVGMLHGDLHHANVLDFGARGWLAIDPKRVFGERTLDFAVLFNDPDAIFDRPDVQVATADGRLASRAAIVADAAGVEPARLLRWIIAYSGLSAAWFIADGDNAKARLPLDIAGIAARELGTSTLPTGQNPL